MRRILTLALATFAIAATPQAGSAQTAQKISVQGSALYTALFGTAFEDFNDGIGGELQLRYTPGAWSIGGGVQYTMHNTSEAAKPVISKVKLLGFFIEPRYVIDAGSAHFAPYISGRFATSTMKLDLGDDLKSADFEVTLEKPSGPTINGGGGVLFRLNDRANLDVGVTFGYTKFKDITGTVRDVTTGQSESFTVQVGNGTNAVFRVGFAYGIGG